VGARLWRAAKFYVLLASAGIHADRNASVPAGRGGLAIGVSSQLAPFVTLSQVTHCGWAILLLLDGLPMGLLGLLNIYGPNDGAARATLWNT
jgi:hypothetical protein